jgi:CRISPR-associated exonuclease Cas4
MFSEDELLPISALQHLLFCERQCALIHIECVWDENRLTAEGRILHEKVHTEGDEKRKDVKITRGLRLRSLRLGLAGIADFVEFHKDSITKKWLPFPVEYKRGKPKTEKCDAVQLCAQVLCLEEMLDVAIPRGALFYGQTRRREDVVFDEALRRLTEQTAEKLHLLFDNGITPNAIYEKKCDSCSLVGLCLPKIAGRGKSAKRFLANLIEGM